MTTPPPDTAIRAALGAQPGESTLDAAERVVDKYAELETRLAMSIEMTHTAERERNEAETMVVRLRAAEYRAHEDAKRTAKSLIAGQERLQQERDAAREALLNLLRLFAGYSVDTKEVGFCTVSDSDRRWIDEARELLWPRKENAE